MKKLLILSFLVLFVYSCGGSGNDSGGGNKNNLEPVSSSISLRLGQLAKLDTPVAVSAALQNGESILIFSRGEGELKQFDVVYKSPTGETLVVVFSPDGRPLSAQSADASVVFENYTPTTVDVVFNVGSTSRRFPNQPIDQNSVAFLEGNTMLRILLGLDSDIDSGTRALLAAAFSSLKVVGCLSDSLLNQFQSFESFVPSAFSNVTSGICLSSLLNSISEILDRSEYAKITVTDLRNFSACDAPFSFENDSNCATQVSVENVIASRRGFVGPFPRATPEQSTSPTPVLPIATPTPDEPLPTPTPTPPPPRSGNLGNWFGTGSGDSQQTGCRDYSINFSVGEQGSPSCSQPNVCGLAGMMIGIDDTFIDIGINGTVDEKGAFAFSGMQVNPFQLEVKGSGILNGNSGSGRFRIDSFECDGDIVLGRNPLN